MDYTDATFGNRQTEAYVKGLQSSFEIIVQFHGIGVAVFEIKPNLRRYRFQSHHIYHTGNGEEILIEAVVHARRRIRPDLFDV